MNQKLTDEKEVKEDYIDITQLPVAPERVMWTARITLDIPISTTEFEKQVNIAEAKLSAIKYATAVIPSVNPAWNLNVPVDYLREQTERELRNLTFRAYGIDSIDLDMDINMMIDLEGHVSEFREWATRNAIFPLCSPNRNSLTNFNFEG